MGNAYDPVTAGTQSSFAQSEATRRNSNRFRRANSASRFLLLGMKHIETALPFRFPFGTSTLTCGRLRTSVNA
jgi:hypothetical protein